MNKKYKIGDEVLVRGVVNSEVRNGGIHVLHDGVDAFYTLDQIDEPQKPKVPQVAVEFYERYKYDGLSLGEWFGDFYSPEAIEDFPRMEELTKWLHDNDNETNRQREFALATLVTLGIDAVEVEKPKLYTVEIPNPNGKGRNRFYLLKDVDTGRVMLCRGNFNPHKNKTLWLTESAIKEDFEWAWQAGFTKEVTQ